MINVLKNRDLSPGEKAAILSREAFIASDFSHPHLCIDDQPIMRISDPTGKDIFVLPEQNHGPHLLGGSLGLVALMVETSPEGKKPELEQLNSLISKACETTGMVMGVHMYNNHDQKGEAEIQEEIRKILDPDIPITEEVQKCGFNSMLHDENNPLGLKFHTVDFMREHPYLIAELVRQGVKISVLAHGHAEKAKAVSLENKQRGTTLDTQKAYDMGLQAYDHDDEPLKILIEALAGVVEKDDPIWAENLRKKAFEINQPWLRIAANALTAMDPIPVE